MNEYNERTLKNVLQDVREENDIELLKEIEAAANNPLYKNEEKEAEKFTNKHCKTVKTKPGKILSKVAAILLILAIGSAVIPLSVEGKKSTIAELIINYVNSEFFAVDNSDPLLTFEGEYVPTWIPDGYEVDSVTNTKEKKEIIFKNSDNYTIAYMELSPEYKINIDTADSDNIKNVEINGVNAVYMEKDSWQEIMITTEDLFQYISCNDTDFDLIGFAELIEKR